MNQNSTDLVYVDFQRKLTAQPRELKP